MAFDEVKDLREEYEAAQDAAEAKRVAYHSAVRKLYMSGVSLREIAEQLGISHQRVHKIVGLEPAKRRKKRRIGATIALIISLALTALFALVSIGSGVAVGAELYNPRFFVTLNMGVPKDEARSIVTRLKAGGRVLSDIYYPEADYEHSRFIPEERVLIPGEGYWIREGKVVRETERSPAYLLLTLRSIRDEAGLRRLLEGMPQVDNVDPPDDWLEETLFAVTGAAALATLGAAILSRRVFRKYFRPRRTQSGPNGPAVTPV